MLNQHCSLKWRSPRAVRWSSVPQAWVSWLQHKTSMTERMRGRLRTHFRLQVLQHRWKIPNGDEARQLHLKSNELAIVRESLLFIDNKACMFARCIFPRGVLTGKGYRFQNLGVKPLGEILFRDPCLSRSAFEYAKLLPGHQDYRKVVSAIEEDLSELLWMRRSIFGFNRSTLLLTEIFLPPIYETNL